jgi:hypothetical protein
MEHLVRDQPVNSRSNAGSLSLVPTITGIDVEWLGLLFTWMRMPAERVLIQLCPSSVCLNACNNSDGERIFMKIDTGEFY